MVNDVSALRQDAVMADLVAERKVPVILMHMQGLREICRRTFYADCVSEIAEFFDERIARPG